MKKNIFNEPQAQSVIGKLCMCVCLYVLDTSKIKLMHRLHIFKKSKNIKTYQIRRIVFLEIPKTQKYLQNTSKKKYKKGHVRRHQTKIIHKTKYS